MEDFAQKRYGSNRPPLTAGFFLGVTILLSVMLLIIWLAADLLETFSAESGGKGDQLQTQREQLQQWLNKSDGKDLQNEINVLKKEITDKRPKLLDPGPRPSWWHLIDLWKWYWKQRAFDKLKENLADLELKLLSFEQKYSEWQKEYHSKKGELEELERKLAQQEFWQRTKEVATGIWNRLVRPIFHLLLLLGSVTFGLRLSLRLALLQGWIGTARL
jgi:hypothetical protein